MADMALFVGLGDVEGWHWINMPEVMALMQFGATNGEVQAVFGVCYTSLLSSGSIIIEPIGEEGESGGGGGGGSRVILPDARAESEQRARSTLFGEWGRAAAFVEECIGWFATTAIVDASCPDGMRPVVINMARVDIMHRMDVYGRHHWRWFEVISQAGTRPGRTTSRAVSGLQDALPGQREMFDVRVVGANLPDNAGELSSRIKRVYHGEWAMYQMKKHLTSVADQERANPTLVTQAHDSLNDRIGASASAHESFDQGVPDADADACRSAQAVHHRVQMLNSGRTTAMQLDAPPSAANVDRYARERARMPLYEIDEGRIYVKASLAEAPADLAVARMAFFESVCLAWGIPMAMLSAGDATGKSKLSPDTASPETGRIFREAQSDRKRLLERNICDMYEHMHAARMASAYIASEVKHKWKRDTKKRRRHTDDDGDADACAYEEMMRDDRDDESDRLSFTSIQAATRMRVQIPCNAMSDQLVQRLEMGVLKYSAFCAIDAQQLGLSLSAYNRVRIMPEEPGTASKTKSKTKTKAKTKPKAKAKKK